MNLKEMRYLVALADCLNFSRAAERCAVTQPTLSIQVRKLEEYLGVQLFERGRGAHVRLTPDGERVLDEARVIVAAADRLMAERHCAADGRHNSTPRPLAGVTPGRASPVRAG